MSREKSDEELRKIQVTGGSTYIISLPKNWIDQMGLKRSSVVSIIQRDDMSLSIQPKGIESPERVKKVIIAIKQGEKPESVVRRLSLILHQRL